VRASQLLKWAGVAGLVGVTATGVAVARAERRRASYTPEQVRARLHERAGQPSAVTPAVPAAAGPRRSPLSWLHRRRRAAR
jgi:hypothetical protein